MNNSVLGLRVASIIFGLVCVGQLTRLLLQLQVVVAGYRIPVWWSGVAVIATGGLCAWLWSLSTPGKPGAPGGATPTAS